MNENAPVFHPLGIFGAGVKLWARYLIPVMAVNGLVVFAFRILQICMRNADPLPPGSTGFFLSVFLGIEAVTFIVVISFVSLFIVHFLKAGQTEQPVFSRVFDRVREQMRGYLLANMLLLFFFVVGFVLSGLFLSVGHFLYARHPGTSMSLGVLLTTSTAGVALAIAVVWYGYYFTLSPLIAAFENMRIVDAFRESRSRIRGNALRYGFLFAIYLALYLLVGMAVYFVLKSGPFSAGVLYAIDPVMGWIFGPLWLALWLLSYEHLTSKKYTKIL